MHHITSNCFHQHVQYTTRYEKVLYCTNDACKETEKCNYDRLWQQKNIIQHQLLTGAADKITPKKAYSKNLMKYIPLENSRRVNAKKSECHWQKDTKSMTLTEKEDGRPAKLILNE